MLSALLTPGHEDLDVLVERRSRLRLPFRRDETLDGRPGVDDGLLRVDPRDGVRVQGPDPLAERPLRVVVVDRVRQLRRRGLIVVDGPPERRERLLRGTRGDGLDGLPAVLPEVIEDVERPLLHHRLRRGRGRRDDDGLLREVREGGRELARGIFILLAEALRLGLGQTTSLQGGGRRGPRDRLGLDGLDLRRIAIHHDRRARRRTGDGTDEATTTRRGIRGERH